MQTKHYVRSHTFSQNGYIDLTGLTEYKGIKLATGATVTKESLLKENYKVYIKNFGAVALEDRAQGDIGTYAIKNTKAINAAISDVAAHGGGTVVFPAGTFRTYTIKLESNVNLYMEEGCVIQAARTTIYGSDGKIISLAEDFDENGDPGNYLKPEVNIYAGLQDGGHSHFANSLIYAADKKNIMIYGEGLLDGSQINGEGYRDQVLAGRDPSNPSDRTGQTDAWYGNKAISFLRCDSIVLSGFNILNGGHFAIITEGTTNVLVEDMIVDTNRDAFNIDCCQDMTIRDSVFNTLTDDALVFKASYGAGMYMPVQNCLVYNCVVSGYDGGSVLAGTYTSNRQICDWGDSPNGRIKFGTESTCGYNTVTIMNVHFQRSRGLALESVDGDSLHDILLVNSTMDNVSSSPIYIRIGNRGLHPVTGNTPDTTLNQPDNIRLTNTGWILPQNTEDSEYTWTEYPVQNYYPAYTYDNKVTMSNGIQVTTVNQQNPAQFNQKNFYYDEASRNYYKYKWDEVSKNYVVDKSARIDTHNNGVDERYYYGDAVGYKGIARVYNIYVGNVKITNVDPRYPVILAGLVDSKIKNVTLENIDITYRGGMRMTDAVEQQQLNTDWKYTQYMTAPAIQSLRWLVNSTFATRAALLPRVDWDPVTNSWTDDPYNVPEMNEQYPEASNFGILPAYGMYARHVDGLALYDVTFKYMIDDERHAVVLDDCQNVEFNHFSADVMDGVQRVVLVSNNYKRATNFEYIKNQPYISTSCSDIRGVNSDDILSVTVNAPEPSTPNDTLYTYPTIASSKNGYQYKKNIWSYKGIRFDLPVTVYRPFFIPIDVQQAQEGETVTFTVSARYPAAEREGTFDQVASNSVLFYYAEELPVGARFDKETKTFTWTPNVSGDYKAIIYVTDGVIPVSVTVPIRVNTRNKNNNVIDNM